MSRKPKAPKFPRPRIYRQARPKWAEEFEATNNRRRVPLIAWHWLLYPRRPNEPAVLYAWAMGARTI